MKRTKTVSLCMIVKNEEEFLGRCLKSVEDLVDEMIIVDTGSEDNTVNIAKDFGADVYYYKWDNSFSNARNFSLSKATKDWILILDGDDEFEREDAEKFIEIVNNSNKEGHFFKTLSLNSEFDLKNYSYNLNLRLLKNNGEYEFHGAIHEQIKNKLKEIQYKDFQSNEIRIYHRGYIESVAKKQNKRKRNMTLIMEELKKDPFNGFYNFNMANEYCSLGDYKTALEYFEVAYKNIDLINGYANKLVLRRILALITLRKYKKALIALDEGLDLYPNFTDLVFYKALVYEKQKKYTMAIKAYEKAINMGEAPIELRFLNGCSSFRAYQGIAQIYFKMDDYDEAIKNYEKAIECDRTFWTQYYSVTKLYVKIFADEEKVYNKIKTYFNLKDNKEVLILASVFIDNQLYKSAINILNDKYEEIITDQFAFLLGKALFYNKNYIKAFYQFKRIPSESPYYDEALQYIILIKKLEVTPLYEEDFNNIKSDIKKNTIILVNNLMDNKEIDDEELSEEYLNEIFNVLEIFLAIKEFGYFEKLLPLLNKLSSDKILLNLAKLYYKYGYVSLAIEEITRSFKEFGVIDEESIEIFNKNLFI
ncbi:MAG: tetratricopeptide repeat-containing glycosyltransferase family 2 protein [Clostridium sp.]